MAATFFSKSGRGSCVSWLVVSLGLFSGMLLACSGESDEAKGDDDGNGGDSGAGSGQGGSSGSAEGGSSGTAGDSSGGASGNTGGSSGASAGSSGTSSGGRGGDAGNAGGGTGGKGGSGGMEQGGTGASAGEPGCTGTGEGTDTPQRYGQRARSSGWSGTDAQYSELYDVPCSSVDDCVDPCTMRGGTNEMCEASMCIDSTTDYCLPPTVWRNLTALRAEGTMPEDGAVLTLVFDPYQDFLLVDDFKLEVPADSEILGITVTIRRAGGSSMEAVDGAVRLIKGGVVGTSDRAVPTQWTGPEYVNVDYGGPTDLWGQTWTPADVNATNFGVALSAIYTDTAGNGRAYVDIVYVTVHYRACD